MPVSDKMISPCIFEVIIDQISPGRHGVQNAREVAQAVINAAWKPFDGDDESTWPEKGIHIVIEDGATGFSKFRSKIFDKTMKRNHYMWSSVTHYADPADLMPEIK